MASFKAESTAADHARALFQQRVIIVEDEQAFAETLQSVLEQRGFNVSVLSDSSFEALVSFCPEGPDLLVCDINLPSGSGRDFCRMVLERYPKCEAVLMTGAIDYQEPIPVCGTFKLPTFLQKPFSLIKFADLAVALTAR